MNGHLWLRIWRPVTIPMLALSLSLTAAGWAAAQVSQQLPSATDLTPADFPPRLQTPGPQTPADYPGSPYEIYDSPRLAPVQCVPPDPAPPEVFSSPPAPPAAAPAPPSVVAPRLVAPPFVARPYRAAYPPVYEIRRGIVGQPVIRIPGQPLRNFLRFITP